MLFAPCSEDHLRYLADRVAPDGAFYEALTTPPHLRAGHECPLNGTSLIIPIVNFPGLRHRRGSPRRTHRVSILVLLGMCRALGLPPPSTAMRLNRNLLKRNSLHFACLNLFFSSEMPTPTKTTNAGPVVARFSALTTLEALPFAAPKTPSRYGEPKNRSGYLRSSNHS